MIFRILLFLAVFGIIFSCQNGNEFRFAWLSDTHVSETSSGEEDLRAAVKDINDLGEIDFVLVTGDITDLNIHENLQIAKNVLDELEMPYYIIPGNHDTKWTDTGNENFIQLWGDDKFVFDQGYYKFIGLHQGPELRMADGHFAPHDLIWLDSLLSSFEDKDQPLVFVTHYPIDPSVDNYHHFLELLEGYNVNMFLHGHGHRNRLTEYAGIPGVMGRSSLKARAEHGGFTIAEFKSDSVRFFERITLKNTKQAWASLPLGEKFSVDKSKIKYPDFSINDDFAKVVESWVVNSGNLMVASPVTDGKTVFLGDARGTFHAIDLISGTVVWAKNVPGRIYSTAALAEDVVVFASTGGSIYCLDKINGQQIWQYKSDFPIIAVPVIDQSQVLFGSSEGLFRSIDLKTGNLDWQFEGVNGFVESKPVVYKDKVVFTAWDKSVYALNTNDGKLVWKWAEGRDHLLYSPAACWPVAADDKIFITAPDRYLTAIDAENGKTVWRSNKYKVRESLGISEDGRRIYAECMRDTVFAVSARSENFKPVWIKNYNYGYDIAPSMLVERNGTVFFGTKNGLVLAFEGATGQLKWKHKFGNTLINTVCPIDANSVVISNMDGQVTLLTEDRKI